MMINNGGGRGGYTERYIFYSR